ncbi:MAG: hypothetical protein AB7F23_02295 [Phycisphaerae bacterium]|jgi:hypothetical protein
MKDIIITKKKIILEIVFCFIALAVAEGMNIHAIKKYNTNWSELWNQWLTVFILAAIIYALFTAIRIIGFLIIAVIKAASEKRKAKQAES